MPRFFRPGARPVRILLIIDASGSMAGYQEKVMAAIGGFLGRLALEAGEYLVTIVEFSGPSNLRIVARAQPAAAVAFYYTAEGGTALFDAIACGLHAERATSDPTVCLILTDGEENSSREYRLEKIYALVQERLWQGTWTFLWLNMQGSENANARALEIECLDFSRDDIDRVLAELAIHLASSVARMRMEGGRKVEIRGLLGRSSH